MEKSMFLAELKRIFTNKKVLIPIIAVIFVPILYAGMFLWSFWDPYDHLDDMPVAIVNEDTGATYEGEQLDLGNELVDKLKENDEFQFHFVSKEEGYRDLEDREYYILVEIPKDFSKNATTLMDHNPKKLQLKYVPNESHNFLSSQIGETAVDQIKSAIASEVSATYAENMFDQIYDVADGLQTASDGSKELNDGAVKLDDGAKEIKDNLEVLASSSIEFENGVTKAHEGVHELETGSKTLADGIGQLSDAGDQLYGASKDVQKGSETLKQGVSQAHAGIQEMNEKVPELVSGTNQVQQGLKQFQQQLPIQMAGQIGNELQASAGKMNEGINELNKGINKGLNEQFAPSLAGGLAKNMSESIAKSTITSQTEQIENIVTLLKMNQVDEQVIQTVVQQLKEASPSEEQLQKGLQAELQPKIEAGVKQGLSQFTPQVDKGFAQYSAEVNKQLTGATTGLESQIKKAVDPTFNQLSGGLSTINAGQKALKAGITELAQGASQLDEGTNALASGQQEYVRNMQMFTEKLQEAKQGGNELAAGTHELNNGMVELADGSEKIADGSGQLADGSKELASGTSELQDGTEELHSKLDEAANEASDVNATDETYDMFGNPVEMEKHEINTVPNYGTGFAPYFISLGLFVGALLITIVFNLSEPAIQPQNGISWFLSKFGVLLLVGVVQAILVDLILLLGLGLEVENIPLFMMTTIITSLVFMTLIQVLVTWLGDPGRFIAIVILILQLTTSAGTFPLELIPKAIQPINAALPMTYTVQAFKAVISSGDYSFMWHNIGILFIYIVVCTALTATYFIVKSKKNGHAYDEDKVTA